MMSSWIALAVIVHTIFSLASSLSISETVQGEPVGPNRFPCSGEDLVLTCIVSSGNAQLVWGVAGREEIIFSRTGDPLGMLVNYTRNGVIKGRFNLTGLSGEITSTLTLFDIGSDTNRTEVYCHGNQGTSASSIIYPIIGQITAPSIVSVLPLNDSAVQIKLAEPSYGAECITGYSATVHDLTSYSSSTEVVLNGVSMCDMMYENVTVRAHGVSLLGDPAVTSTELVGSHDLLHPEDFMLSYLLLQSESYSLNLSLNYENMAVLEGLTELLQFSAAVSNSSDSSNCHDYRPFDIGSGFSQQLTRDSAHLGTNISLCINIQIQNCSNSKVFVLSVPVSPIEITRTTTVSLSSASVSGRVDLSKVQAPPSFLQVRGLASTAGSDAPVYVSPTSRVDASGGFSLSFLGLPPASAGEGELVYSVELSLRGVVFGSVPGNSLNLGTVTQDQGQRTNINTTTTPTSPAPADDNCTSTILPVVAALSVFLGFLLGTLTTFFCTLVCLRRVKGQHRRRSSNTCDGEPMYEVVGTSRKQDEKTHFSINDAYGSGKFGDEMILYETAGPASSKDGIGLIRNGAYGPMEGSRGNGIELKTNEAYGPMEGSQTGNGINLKTNEAYGSTPSHARGNGIDLKANEAYGPAPLQGNGIDLNANEANGSMPEGSQENEEAYVPMMRARNNTYGPMDPGMMKEAC